MRTVLILLRGQRLPLDSIAQRCFSRHLRVEDAHRVADHVKEPSHRPTVAGESFLPLEVGGNQS